MLLSACLEGETAAASTPVTQGMSGFTWALSRSLLALGPNRSAAELITRTYAELRRGGLRQTPQIKEPIAPPGMSDLSFIELAPVVKRDDQPADVCGGIVTPPFSEVSTGEGASSNDFLGSLIQIIRALTSKESISMGSDQKSLFDVLPVILPLLKASQQQKSILPMNWPPGFPSPFNPFMDFVQPQKNFVDDLMRTLPVILPLIKGSAGADKSVIGDIARVAGAIIPLLKSGPAMADKSWVDDAVRVLTVVAPLIKSSSPQAASKDVLGDVLSVISVVGPLLKGAGDGGASGANKGFMDIVSVMVPLLLAA